MGSAEHVQLTERSPDGEEGRGLGAEFHLRMRMLRAGVPYIVKVEEVMELPSGAICSKPLKESSGV